VGGKLEKSKETVQSMLYLYENSTQSEHKFKGRIISSLLNKRMDLFLALMNKNYSEIVDEYSLKTHIIKVFELLVRAGIPVFFETSLFKFEIDKFYNITSFSHCCKKRVEKIAW